MITRFLNKLRRTSAVPGNKYHEAIIFFQGQIVNPSLYPNTIAGFDKFLKDTGVRFTDAEEFTRPRNRSIARQVGYTSFLPPKEWWERSAALAMMFTRLREYVGSPVYIYNAWRPEEYNSHRDIGGAAASDHITNNAIDCDFHTPENRRKAEAWLRNLYENPLLDMSLGLGQTKIHIGILSPRGNRHWYYSSYPSSERRPL
jgi:hypothetical protein